MQPASLNTQCMNVIIEHLCERHYKNSYHTLLKQLKGRGLIQLFTNHVYERLVEWYPEYLTDDVLATICNKRLKCLRFEGCGNVTLAGVQGVLERCPSITSLDISGCHQLITPTLCEVLQKTKLKTLVLNGCTTLNDTLLQSLLHACPILEELSIDECEQITDTALSNLSIEQSINFINPLGSYITTISLAGCRNISNSFIRSLTAVTKSNLRSVNLSCCGVDCVALVYLAGYTFAPTNANGGRAAAADSNPTNSKDKYEEEHADKSVSFHLKKVCAFCVEDIVMRKNGYASSSVTTLESQATTTTEENSNNDVNEGDTAASHTVGDGRAAFDFRDWDIISLDDVAFEEKDMVERQCECSQINSDNLKESALPTYESKDDLSDDVTETTVRFEDQLQQIFEPNITILDVTQIVFFENGVGSQCLEIFVNANKCLQEFSISWELLSNSDLACIAQNEVGLKSLSLVDCLEVNGEGITVVGDCCHDLVNIDLKGVSFVNDTSLIHLVENNKNVRCLGFAESSLSDQVVSTVTRVLEDKLVHLDLSWCENITDTSVVTLLSKCSALKYLNLRQCEVTHVTLEAIAKMGQNLTSLGLCGVKGTNDLISQSSIQNLTALHKLTSIDLSWNTLLSDVTIYMLLQNCCCLRTATLVGLKCISSKPFLPIIADHKKWYKLRNDICQRLQAQLGTGCRTRLKNFSQLVVIDKDFYLPFRSVNYACELRELSLNYCDKVDDDELAEIVAVCRGTLKIDDYYGELIKQRWNPKDLLAAP